MAVRRERMKAISYDATPGGVMVQVHHGTPSDEEWDAVVGYLGEHMPHLVGVVAIVLGGDGLTPLQREKLTHVLDKMPEETHFALLSDSRITRGVLTAINWLSGRSNQSHVFPSDGLEDALQTLKLTTAQAQEVRELIGRLEAPPGT